MMKLGGHGAHLHTAAADIGQQLFDIAEGQRFELDSLQAIRFQGDPGRIELARRWAPRTSTLRSDTVNSSANNSSVSRSAH